MIISVTRYDDEATGKRLSGEYTATRHNHSRRRRVVLRQAGDGGAGRGRRRDMEAWMPEPMLRRREGHVSARVARYRT